MTTRLGLQPAVSAALAAALLFGVGTPLAKVLPHGHQPVAAGRAALPRLRAEVDANTTGQASKQRAQLAVGEWPWLAGAVIGPVLLMYGLAGMLPSGAALLLNAEGVFSNGYGPQCGGPHFAWVCRA